MKRMSESLFESLENRYGPLWPWPDDYFSDDPFKNLVLTILSQNTSENNCLRAYKGLKERFEITPQALIAASESEIKEAIRPGGLYNLKAKRLKDVARVVIDEYDNDLGAVLALPKDKAKEQLLKLPGIGDKTADVILTTVHSYREVIPVDTHMDRVAKRLGLVEQRAGYEAIQEALKKFIPPRYRERGSGLLWLLAKHTCKPRNPRCRECELVSMCRYPSLRKGR
ncbi:MAG: endonuclease III [Thermoplasmata archaeon]|nr:MAG: endonuclease III [Thermoplasmata archaeon]